MTDRLAVEREVVSRVMEYDPVLTQHVVKWSFRQGLYKKWEATWEEPESWSLCGFSDTLDLRREVLWGGKYVGLVLVCTVRRALPSGPPGNLGCYAEPRLTPLLLTDPSMVGFGAQKACDKIISLLTESFPSRAQPIVRGWDDHSYRDYALDGMRP